MKTVVSNWKTYLGALVATIILMASAACSSGSAQDVSYEPTAYGENGYCYYLETPMECTGYHSGIPMLMPLYWHERYYTYYSSPAYYGHYMPASYRTVYITHSTSFGSSYSSQIRSSRGAAQYKGSNGKVYNGNSVKPGGFTGTNRNSGGGFGSGSRTKTCSMGPITGVPLGTLGFAMPQTKGGGGSSGGSHSGGSSYGGGSRGGSSYGGGSRSGSSSGGSSSGSSSGSRHTC